MVSELERHWYLICTKPRSEYVARENLERQGYRVYLPEIREARRRKGRLVTVVVPMFPRYLFIELSEQADNWSPLRSTVGVSNVVYFGQKAARAPASLMDELKCREDEEGILVLPAEQYQPGSPVRIVAGGLIGYEGMFQARKGKDRASILLYMLGRHIETAVPLDQIEPLS